VSKPLRYRPIRGALWVIFLCLALGFVGLVVVAVVRGVMAEDQLAVLDEPQAPSNPTECAMNLGELYRSIHLELDRQRAAPAQDDAAGAAGWAPLRARLDALGVRCDLVRGRRTDPLGRAYKKVVALQRLTESAAVQYRHQVGPADLEARQLLTEAGAKPE